MSPKNRRLTPWKRVRYAIESAAVKSAAAVLPLLPRRVAVGIAWLLGSAAWLCDAGGRRIGMENLRVIFGEQYSVRQRRRIIRGSYRVFARTFIDLFWSPRLTPENLPKFVRVETASGEARRVLEENHCIVVTAHFGAFEMAGFSRALLGHPAMTVAQDFRNPALTRIFSHLRSAGGRQPLIPRDGAILKLLKWVKKGGSAAALVDLTVKPEQAAVPVKRFGRWTSGSQLQCILASRAEVPILCLAAYHQPGGRVLIRILEPYRPAPGDSAAAIAQRCWDLYEPLVREQPEQWMWMYRHWLYRPSEADAAEYPAYSKVKPEFDALLREPAV